MGRIIKTYDYDEVSFDLKDIYDNSYAYIDVVFDMDIHANDLFTKLKDEILNNPKKYPKLNRFFKNLTEDKRNDILESYIYLYPGYEYQDDVGDYLDYDTFSVKVRYTYNGKDVTVNIDDVYYPDVYDAIDYKIDAKELFKDDKKTLDRFIRAMDDYINVYNNIKSGLIDDVVDKYFLDIVDDNMGEGILEFEEQIRREANEEDEDVSFRP